MTTNQEYRTVLLIGMDDTRPYGVMTEHGAIWGRTKDEVVRLIKFVFGVRRVVFEDQRLTRFRAPIRY